MASKLIYQGKEVKPLPETFSGLAVDVVTSDGKTHLQVPLSSLDTIWTNNK
jgi:hypothetical protein